MLDDFLLTLIVSILYLLVSVFYLSIFLDTYKIREKYMANKDSSDRDSENTANMTTEPSKRKIKQPGTAGLLFSVFLLAIAGWILFSSLHKEPPKQVSVKGTFLESANFDDLARGRK